MGQFFADEALTQQLASQAYAVQQVRAGQRRHIVDQLAEEVPIALVYNGISHAVMLATPQDLEDFALGFSLTEGILQQPSELYALEVMPQANGIELQIEIASERFAHLKERRRSMVGRTGCGLCGAESLSQVFRLSEPVKQSAVTHAISEDSIFKAHQAIQTLQVLQQVTGATHACAWADDDGNIGWVREDVGRHNAMDKLLGALAKANQQGGFIVTTSRASYEMVQKVAMLGYDILAAISAPTGLAVRIAEASNVTLLGFVRDKQYVVYSQAHRILASKS